MRFATLSQSIWLDEAVTVRDVSGSFAHLISSVAHHEPTPPLYFICLWLWRHVFGDSVFAMRTLSALAGTLTIPVAYAATNRLVGRRIALTVGVLAASSPVLLYYSQELRTYALLVLLCALGFLAFVAALQTPSARKLAIWGALSSLALASHYFAALAVLPQGIVLMGNAWRARAPRRPTVIAFGAVGCVSVALAGLLHYQYARSYRFSQTLFTSAFVSEPYNAHTPGVNNTGSLAQQLFIGPAGPFKMAATLAVAAVFLLALIRLWRHPKDPQRRGGELALMLVLPAIAAAALFGVLTISLQGRYLLPLWLPMAIVIACGLSSPRARMVGVAATTSLCALGLVVGIGAAIVPRFGGRPDMRGVAYTLGPAVTARVIAIDQPLDLLPLQLYRPEARVYTRPLAQISELDVVAVPVRGFPGDEDANPPPPPRISGLPRGMTLRQVIRSPTYTIARYTSRTPVTVPISPAGNAFSVKWRFLYEPRGGRAGGP